MTIKFQKREYGITIHDGESIKKETVSGLAYDLFGIHKNENRQYVVTHIPTGYLLVTFAYQKQAKDFVDRASSATWPVPLEKITMDNMQDTGKKNADKFHEIISLIK